MANDRVAMQVFRATNAVGRFMPPVMFILADNPDVPMRKVLTWERQLVESSTDATCREVYADWLKERGCHVRESQVRYEAAVIRADNAACPGWELVHATPALSNQNLTNPGLFTVTLPIEWRYTGRCPVPGPGSNASG